MKRLMLIALTALAGCGGFENEPFKTGVLRGQLVGTDATALVSVVGHENLSARPDAAGRFELANVPLGQVDLLVIVNALQSKRFSVEVGGASIVELGVVEPRPSVKFEVHVKAPGHQWLGGGRVSLLGTPLSEPLELDFDEAEAEFYVPPGCYDAQVTVPGLGDVTRSGCVAEGESFDTTVRMPEPDGSPGREGCEVTGCPLLLTCQSDRTCR
jgi:hypothetical protein